MTLAFFLDVQQKVEQGREAPGRREKELLLEFFSRSVKNKSWEACDNPKNKSMERKQGGKVVG